MQARARRARWLTSGRVSCSHTSCPTLCSRKTRADSRRAGGKGRLSPETRIPHWCVRHEWIRRGRRSRRRATGLDRSSCNGTTERLLHLLSHCRLGRRLLQHRRSRRQSLKCPFCTRHSVAGADRPQLRYLRIYCIRIYVPVCYIVRPQEKSLFELICNRCN